MPDPMIHAIDIQAPAPTVFEAISTEIGVASFWTSDLDLESEVGSIARFGFPAAPVDLRMRIEALEPDRLVRWACMGDFPFWAGTTVAWHLTEGPDGGTTLLFRHDGWPADVPELEFARVNYTWGRIVGALQSYVETGVRQPFLG